jgi:hypothetical protein
MKCSIKLSGIKGAYSVLLVLSVLLCGCVGPKIATDLLSDVEAHGEPLTDKSSEITVDINPEINNAERLDQSVKESLEIALDNAGIFGTDSENPYKIDAKILTASQSPMSFGSFEGTMEIHYIVHDASGSKILDKKVFTEAGSDKFSLLGAARHRRSRAVNISKNVLQFVGHLQDAMKE